ncbi:MAG: hypothetical protein ACJATA_000726 [Sphingobacteriales bacterium]
MEAGTYNEQIEFYNIPNLSAQAKLTVLGDPINPEKIKIIFQSPKLIDNHNVLKINGTSHISITGMTLENTATDTASAIFITQNASNITISNCQIIIADNPSAEILIGVSGSNNSFLNFNGESGNNNKIINSTFIGGTHSISIFGELPTKMSSGYEVLGNRMLNFIKAGIFGADVNFKNISNNEISEKPESPNSYGIIINESDSAITINANKIAGVSKSGITAISQNLSGLGENLVSNNMILGNESNEISRG